MKTRMQKLWDKTVPLGGCSPQPDPRAVLRRVNAALDRKPHMSRAPRQPLKYALLLITILLLLLSGTAIAVESIFLDRNVLGAFFSGDDSEYALSLINIEQNSVSDENYTMTVTSSIADEERAYFTLIIEPKTEKARDFLSGNGEELFALPLTFRASWIGGHSTSIYSGPLSGGSNLFFAEVSMDIGVGLWKTVYARMEDMEKGTWLKIPLEIVHSAKLDIQAEVQGMSSLTCAAGGPVTLKSVKISPLAVQISYTTPNASPGEPFFSLLWKDGTLKSTGDLEMYHTSGSGGSMDTEFRDSESTWKFGQVQDIRQIEAIVFENMAYPLDGGEPYEIDASQIPRPFTVPAGEQLEESGNPSMPLFALCEGLGIPYEWNADAGTLTATLRDVTLKFTANNTLVALDGAETGTSVMHSAPVYQDGELWADVFSILHFHWHVNAERVDDKEPADTWVIIP